MTVAQAARTLAGMMLTAAHAASRSWGAGLPARDEAERMWDFLVGGLQGAVAGQPQARPRCVR